MARTKQTARKSTGGKAGGVVDNPEIDKETAERLKSIIEGSMQAEVKHIDRKFTEDGQTYFAETPALDPNLPDQVDWWDKFAMCLVRHMDQQNKTVVKTTLQINSQHLKNILKATVKDYPGVSFQTNDITLEQPYHVLYHIREDLEGAHAGLEDEEAAQHLDLLLRFIDDTFEEYIEEIKNLLEHGLITYKSLWCILRPGTTIFTKVQGQPRAFTLKLYEENKLGMMLHTHYVDFDGEDFGKRETALLVDRFAGSVRINSLAAFPIAFHADLPKVRSQLLARGRKFEQHAGMHFCNYTGVGTWEVGVCTQRFSVNGRIVVDTKTANRIQSNHAFSVDPFDQAKADRREAIEQEGLEEEMLNLDSDGESRKTTSFTKLTDEQCLLATDRVRGFAFGEKQWLDFSLDYIAPIEWNPQCFDQLVLPEAQKDLVQALVANHIQQRVQFDDIVKGKGRGLVLVLHGPPGVGKTLTAETVAEYCKRPLYMVSSGDLGTVASTLDERLREIMDMASTWKAVLLIDEADVFLEARSLLDIHRNSLVSIFLRELEYYEGIIFLTSNRVATFDEAFKSRIHVPLKYGNLSPHSRQQIWKNFLQMPSTSTSTSTSNNTTPSLSPPTPTTSTSITPSTTAPTLALTQTEIERLAQANLNGRQIKNIVRTAKSLAQFRGQTLDLAVLEKVIRIQREFEEDMDPGKESRMWI